jgi:hypothetical protein
MIIIDYSAIAIANVAMSKVAVNEDMIRHMILNSIRMYRKKFKDYGQMVIVGDGPNNWRKDYYPQYKYKRKKNREESKIDWVEAFRCINMVREELQENFPYKVLNIDGCEADDTIAHIVYNTQEFGNWEDVMIISGDHDFIQLQKYENVKQFSPITKKLVTHPNPRLKLAEHILRGCGGDGVPNVLSHDDQFVNNERMPALTQKKIDTWLAAEDMRKAMGEDIYRNYMRNKKLIDLTETPKLVIEDIINTFNAQDPSKNKSKVLTFLIKKRCKLLIECAGEFI